MRGWWWYAKPWSISKEQNNLIYIYRGKHRWIYRTHQQVRNYVGPHSPALWLQLTIIPHTHLTWCTNTVNRSTSHEPAGWMCQVFCVSNIELPPSPTFPVGSSSVWCDNIIRIDVVCPKGIICVSFVRICVMFSENGNKLWFVPPTAGRITVCRATSLLQHPFHNTEVLFDLL